MEVVIHWEEIDPLLNSALARNRSKSKLTALFAVESNPHFAQEDYWALGRSSHAQFLSPRQMHLFPRFIPFSGQENKHPTLFQYRKLANLKVPHLAIGQVSPGHTSLPCWSFNSVEEALVGQEKSQDAARV